MTGRSLIFLFAGRKKFGRKHQKNARPVGVFFDFFGCFCLVNRAEVAGSGPFDLSENAAGSQCGGARVRLVSLGIASLRPVALKFSGIL